MTQQYDAGALLQIVITGFRRHGAKQEECEEMRETILIRDGAYYGRSFRTARLMATMIAETGCVQFHTSSGELLESVPAPENASRESNSQRQAA
ncbi:MAG: hypothetical protein MPJ50_00955 [Pirellulales bacterium]|nr:hypothetical protein [Pirellulales bacterium]